MNIAHNYQIVKDRIVEKFQELSLNERDVNIILVTKRQCNDKLQQAYQLGFRKFGENQVQEMIEKASSMPNDIEWHFIGSLQSNKVRKVVEVANYIHSIDSLKLLKRLQMICQELDKKVNIFLQVNLSKEDRKSGFLINDLDEAVSYAMRQNNLNVKGLMTMGVKSAQDEQNKAYFFQLAKLNRKYGLQELSMGMSADYLLALEVGATHLRLGSVILGERNR